MYTKIIWRTLLITAILGLATVIGFNYYIKWRLMEEITVFASKKINGLYQVHIDDTQIDVFSGVLEVNGITVTTDTIQWQQTRNLSPGVFPPRIQLSAKSLKIKNFSWFGYFSKREIGLRVVSLDHPDIHILQYRDSTAQDTFLKSALLKLPALISPVAGELRIKHIYIQSGNMEVTTLTQQDSTVNRLEALNVECKDILINEITHEITFCNDISVSCGQSSVWRSSADYTLACSGFFLKKNKKTAGIQGLTVSPVHSEQQFFNKYRYRKPYIAFTCPDIAIMGWDLDRFIVQDYLSIDSVNISKADLQVTINKIRPFPPRRNFLHEMAQKAKQVFHIRELTVKNSDITVVSIDIAGKNTMTFNQAYLTVANISNDTTWMSDSHPMEMWAEMQFMGQSLLKGHLQLPLMNPSFNGTLKAGIESVPLSVLNPLISHKNVSITSGFLRKVDMDIRIQNGVATGNMKMDYSGLSIQLTKEDSGKTRKLATKLANFVVREDNTGAAGTDSKLADTPVYYRRIAGEGFFAYLWHAAQSGLLPGVIPSYETLKKVSDRRRAG